MPRGAVTDRAEAAWSHTSAGEELLTPEEVASRLRVTRRTIYTWLKLGRMRGVRAGKLWRIRPSDLEAFLMPAAAWEERLDESLVLVRKQVPASISDEEITADLEAARDEVHKEHSARGD